MCGIVGYVGEEQAAPILLDPGGEDGRRNGRTGNLRYRTYQVGDSRRTF